MVANGLDLVGRVSVNATPAINSARALSKEFTKLSAEGKATTAEAIQMAKTFKEVGAAANAERTSIGGLAKAQAAVNKQMAEANVIQERANALRRTSLASASSTRKVGNAKASAIVSGAGDKTAIAEGKVALDQQRALTEEVRRTAIAQEAASKISSRNIRDQIAQQRLLLSQQSAQRATALRSSESLSGIRTSLNEAGGAFTHFGLVSGVAFGAVIANAVVMQRQFANVVRTSDLLEQGFSPEKLAAKVATLRGQFDALANELPISYKELTEIGAAANQLGVQSQDVASFTKTVAQFSAVTGVSVDTASTAFGRLNSLIVDVTRDGQKFGGVDNDFQGLADSINKVGVNSVATDQQIINIASQISGIANAAGLGYKEIVGFSGALASVGVSPYLARGLTTRLFGDITRAVADGGAELTKFSTLAGMSAAQFTKAWQSDPKSAILGLFEGIREAGPNAIDVLKGIGVTSVLDQPALIRLANAADKTGKAGALLAQTFRDANSATGENARQYSVIAETVQSRLQVALNRVQILFSKVASSNLGPLSAAILAISDGILNLSTNLDKPVKLLGLLKLPFTNSQLIGVAIGLTGIAAAFTLVVGAGAKFASAIISVRNGYVGLNRILAQARGETVAYAAGADVAAAANIRLATTAEAVSLRFATSNSALARGFGSAIGNGGASAIAKAENAASRLGGGIRKVASGVSGLVGGPVGFAALGLVAAGALGSLSSRVDHLGTSVGALSKSMLTLSSSAAILSSIKIDQRGGLESFIGGVLGDNKTSAYVKNAGQLGKALDQLKGSNGSKYGALGDLSDRMKEITSLKPGNLLALISPITQISRLLAGTGSSSENLGKVVGKLNDSFKNISDASGADTAIVGLQNSLKGLSREQISTLLSSDKFASGTSILSGKLSELGIKVNKTNLAKLVDGTIQLSSADAKAAKSLNDMTNAYGGNAQAAQDYLTAVKSAADSSVDLNAAFQQSSEIKTGDPFGNFIKQAKKNYSDFVDFQKNALKIAHDTGASLADLSALDPGILSGAVKSGKKGEQELAKVMELKDAKDAFLNSVATLDNSPKIADAFSSLGASAQEQVAKSLGEGNDIATAFASAGKKAKAAFDAALAGVSTAAQAKDLQIKISGDAGPAIKASETAADIISNLKAEIKIHGNTLLAKKDGEDAKAYVNRLKSTFQIYGETAPAKQEGESAAQYVSRLKSVINVFANGAPARRKGEDTVSYVDRLKGTITLLGDNAPARRKGQTAKQYIDGLKGIITADAATYDAEHAIDYAARDRTVHLHAAFGGGGNFASGGLIRGPGTGTSDSVPINASNGEYVVRAAAVKRNKALLDSINYSNKRIVGARGYANGGVVAPSSAGYEGTYSSRQSEARSRGPQVSVTELSAYDRHLLVSIQEAVGITLNNETVSRAVSTGNTRQNHRGNG